MINTPGVGRAREFRFFFCQRRSGDSENNSVAETRGESESSPLKYAPVRRDARTKRSLI